MSDSPYVEIADAIPDAIKIPVEELQEGDIVFDVFGGQHPLRKVLRLNDAIRTIRDDGHWDWHMRGTIITIIRTETPA